MKLRNKIFLHLFFWLIVEATWYPHIYAQILTPGDIKWLLVRHLYQVFTFYAFYYFFRLQTTFVTKFLIYVGGFLIISSLRYYGLNLLQQLLGNPQICGLWNTTWNAPFETFMFGAHATFIGLIESRVKFEKLKKDLAEQNMKSELAFLRSQINPHSLYNTLNNIYSLAYPKAPKAAQAVMKLSDIMRYGLTEATNKFVPLQKEIDYLDSYISLEKMRHRDDSFIRFSVTGNPEQKMIAPMIFIPFVENAFKHGITGKQDFLISIRIEIEEEILTFEVVNSYEQNGQKSSGNGIGLKNVKRRLELIYPAKHQMNIDDLETGVFKVILKINLK